MVFKIRTQYLQKNWIFLILKFFPNLHYDIMYITKSPLTLTFLLTKLFLLHLDLDRYFQNLVPYAIIPNRCKLYFLKR